MERSRPPSIRVCMLAHSHYEEDPRVRRQAEALVGRGHEVEVFALRHPTDLAHERVAGVDVHRLPVARHQGAGLGMYLREYLGFLSRASLAAARLHRRRRYAVVEVHSLPDFLVFAALPLRLRGAAVLLDLHEAMPVFFGSRFPRAGGRAARLLLAGQERAAIRVADHVLTVNEALRERLVRLGVPPAKVTVVPNAVSLDRFDPERQPRRPFMAGGTLRLVYTGALTPIYELDVVLAALGRLRASEARWSVELDVYGRGDSAPELARQVTELGLTGCVRFHGRIPIDAVPAAVAAADVGLAPTRLDAFTELSLSTKIYEYAALEKPVIASRLPLVERAFPNGSVALYRPGDAEDLARAVRRLVDDPASRYRAVGEAARLARDSSWEGTAADYLRLIERLASGPRARSLRRST